MLEPFTAFALELDRLVPATGRCPQGRPRRPRDRRDPRDPRAPSAAPCDAIGRIGRCSAVMAASLAYTKGRRKHGQRGRTGLVGLQSFLDVKKSKRGGDCFRLMLHGRESFLLRFASFCKEVTQSYGRCSCIGWGINVCVLVVCDSHPFL